jgi:hypothetical protein
MTEEDIVIRDAVVFLLCVADDHVRACFYYDDVALTAEFAFCLQFLVDLREKDHLNLPIKFPIRIVFPTRGRSKE